MKYFYAGAVTETTGVPQLLVKCVVLGGLAMAVTVNVPSTKSDGNPLSVSVNLTVIVTTLPLTL
jgi:hypothetical protein